jgi:hypothetical protein
MTTRTTPPDTRLVYGATCFWWGLIGEVSTTPVAGSAIKGGLPCCPHCRGMLYELDTEAEWWLGVDAQEAKEPGYRKFIEWTRGRHFRTVAQARAKYEEHLNEQMLQPRTK